MPEPFDDSKHLANSADAMGRCCKSWQSSTARYHFAVRDTILEQDARIEALQAENERLREALRITMYTLDQSYSEDIEELDSAVEVARAALGDDA